MNIKGPEKYWYFAMTDCHKRTELNPTEATTMSSLRAPLVRIEDHKSQVLSCRFHSSGVFFLSSNRDGQIHICPVDSQFSKIIVMKGHTGAVMEANFSRDGSDIYSCSEDKTVGIWDVCVGHRTSILEGHSGGVNSVQAARIGYPVLCSGSKDGTVRIWDAREQSCVMTLRSSAEVTATSFNENGEYVFSSGIDKDIKIWDLRMNEVISKLQGHTGKVMGLSMSPCGSYLLSHSVDSTLRIWDIRPYASSDRCVANFSTQQLLLEELLRCAWSADGTMVSAGTSSSMVYIWDAISGVKLHELQAHESSINDVDFHPNEPIVLTASNDKYLYLHELTK